MVVVTAATLVMEEGLLQAGKALKDLSSVHRLMLTTICGGNLQRTRSHSAACI